MTPPVAQAVGQGLTATATARQQVARAYKIFQSLPDQTPQSTSPVAEPSGTVSTSVPPGRKQDEVTILDPAQFGVPDGGYGATQRYIKAKNGKIYRIQEESFPGNFTVHVVTENNNPNRRPTPQSRVGYLTFYPGRPTYESDNIDGGLIHKVVVKQKHRRAGLATAMLDFARERNPRNDVRHSNVLSPDGSAWAKATPTPPPA